MLFITRCAFLAILLLLACEQKLAAAGDASLCMAVHDVSGAPIERAKIDLRGQNAHLSQLAGENGTACFAPMEPGEYRIIIAAAGFQEIQKTVQLSEFESLRMEIVLKVSPAHEQITVEDSAREAGPAVRAEISIDSLVIHTLPSESVNAGLSSILTLTVPGVAADSNGVFHPLGGHAETSMVVDGQPISDQQSRIFSNQMSLSSVQDLVAIPGAPAAEFGDKTSLVVIATTRSGLGAGKANGELQIGHGSFGTSTATFAISAGSKTLGNFLSVDALQSSRFLDAPEFVPLHANGNAENIFDRLDFRWSDATSIHVNISSAHSWFQTPNTNVQQAAGQDQRQHMTSFNFDTGLTTEPGPSSAVTGNAWIRQDRVSYYPSANSFDDQPATLSQSRRLTSTGGKADVTFAKGVHLLKVGVQVQITPLSEFFRTGLTDPAFNSPCVTRTGQAVPDASLTSPAQCVPASFLSNPGFQASLLPYDLSRGGTEFQFRGATTIYEESAFVQDTIKAGRWTFSPGLRFDRYDGLSHAYGVQPRVGIAYQVPFTATLLRLSYARIFLTPYNENLVLSSATGPGGLANGSLGATSVDPLQPARRNQFNAGIEQPFGKKFSVDAEYFWKFTDGAYDFNVILDTPLNFPVQFRKAKIDGAMVRMNLASVRGFTAFTVMGHTRSRLFSPEVGGINFGQQYAPVARPDHDQGFQQTTYARYQFKPSQGLRP
jgi:hypothetical protein